MNPHTVINSARVFILSYLKHNKNIVFMSEDDINEVISRVSFKVYTKKHLFDSHKSSLSTWVSTITRNTLIDFLKERNSMGLRIDEYDMNSNDCRYSMSPSHACEINETIAALKEYGSNLMGNKKKIFRLLQEEIQNKDIAHECKMSESAVNAAICRIRGDLKRKFPEISTLYSYCQYAV